MTRHLTFGSLFDGIGCFSLAFARAGWQPRWLVELEPDCRRVTAKHFPGVPQYTDVRETGRHCLEPVDLVVGGSPCQDWSVAGRRAGLDGDRAPLFVHLVRVAREVGAVWILWENVPGVFSQRKGRDFAFVLSQFTGVEPEVPPGGWRNTGWGWGPTGAVCWRVCDARYWGVPQRRRRVFALVRLGDFRGLAGASPDPELRRLLRLPAEILLEPEGVFGDPPQGRGEWTQTAACTGRSAGVEGFDKYNQRLTGDTACTLAAGSKQHNNAAVPHVFQANGAGSERPGAPTLATSDDNGSNQIVVEPRIAHTLRVAGCGATEDGTGRGTPLVAFHATQDPVSGDVAPTLSRGSVQGCGMVGVAYGLGQNQRGEVRLTEEVGMAVTTGGGKPGEGYPAVAFQERGREQGRTLETQEDLAYSPMAPQGGGRAHENNIAAGMTVRRLTPTECLRLQGMPDDYLDLDPPLSDSAKYRMIGNGGARPVVEWIALRTRAVEESSR